MAYKVLIAFNGSKCKYQEENVLEGSDNLNPTKKELLKKALTEKNIPSSNNISTNLKKQEKELAFEKEMGLKFTDDTIRIYFNGPDDENIGGNYYFPDIKGAANRLAGLFENNRIAWDKLIKLSDQKDGKCKGTNAGIFKDSVSVYFPSNFNLSHENLQQIEIERLALTGYSRGANFAFATIKALNEKNSKKMLNNTIAFDRPIDLVFNQPVSGNFYTGPGSITHNVQDLSACTNIKLEKVQGFFGNYLNSLSLKHDYFFRQNCPIFPVKSQNTLIPVESHTYSQGAQLGRYHVKNWLANNGYAKQLDENELVAVYESISLYEPLFLKNFDRHNCQDIIGRPELETKNFFYEIVLNKLVANGLSKLGITHNLDDLDEIKKMAIYSIINHQENEVTANKDQILFIMDGEKELVNKFVNIINISTRTVALMLNRLGRNKNKRQAIAKAKNKYLSSIFNISYDYLKDDNSQKNKGEFIKLLDNAKATFIINGHIEQKYYPLLDWLSYFIKSILGLGVANVYNAIKTKTWSGFFFYKSTKSKEMLIENQITIETELFKNCHSN